MKPAKFLMPEFDIPAGLIVLADAGTDLLMKLGEQRLEAQAEIEAIFNAADDSGEDMSDEDLETVEKLQATVAKLDRQIEARKKAVDAAKPAGRKTSADPRPAAKLPGLPAGAARVPATAKSEKDAGTFGYASFGAFVQEVHAAIAGEDKHSAYQRIVNATTTYGNEGTGGDGGFLVPPDFRAAIWKKVTGEDSLFSRVQEFVTGGNGLTFPKDESTPWDTSSGVQAYWGGEGDVKTPSKPVFTMQNLRLNKLFCLVPVSDELLEDAPGLESYLRVKAPEKMQARLNTALVRGNGVGKPLGFLNAASLITVSKELSQDADTVVFMNILKLWSRLAASSRRNAVWIINQDIEPQLMSLAFPSVNGNVVPLYIPGGNIAGSPYSTLFGRPVIPVEAASTLGDKGDISLVDWSQYMGLTKGNGIQTDVSMHIYFDQDLTAFRFVFRVAGTPLWGSVITPENGTMTRSWAVTLEDRA